jgi:chloramphenicol 3-O phosphotransferase
MMPEQYIAFGDRSKQGYFSFTENSTPQKKVISIDTSELGKQLFMLLPKFTKMLADTGHDVIVDEVFYKHSSIDSYRLELARHQLTYVGVYCDLDILNERELLRGDRAIGLANDQFSKVHDDDYPYDLKVDSSHSSSFELAREILEYVTPALKSNEC